jgi:aldose 1-epimerase
MAATNAQARRLLQNSKLVAAAVALIGSPAPVRAIGDADRAIFGKTLDGRSVEVVTLKNSAGMSVRVLNYGATLQSIQVPDRDGRIDDVLLGYDRVADYEADTAVMGVTIGRYANRIAKGTFSLDGQTFKLDTDSSGNHLHGGATGVSKKLWTIERVETSASPTVVMSLTSPDGEGGYPGELRMTATFTLAANNELRVDYAATTNKPTVLNLTSHGYFNLAGARSGRSATDHLLILNARQYTPIDAAVIPTGEKRDVKGTAFDFIKAKPISKDLRKGSDAQIRLGRGYDHNFIVNGTPGVMRRAARLYDPVSGRAMDLAVTSPGLQFYSGNFLDGTVAGKHGHLYRQGDGVCLEPQGFPDAPNHGGFPSTRLDPGSAYRNSMVFRFSVVR